MINKIYAIGRLTADPTLSNVGGVSCTNFSVASDTRTKDSDGNPQTNFYRVSAWRGIAEICAQYLHKGDRVAILGDLSLRTFMDKNGEPRSAMQVTLSDVEFLSERPRGENNEQGNAQYSNARQANSRQTTPQQSQKPNKQQIKQTQAEFDDNQDDDFPF